VLKRYANRLREGMSCFETAMARRVLPHIGDLRRVCAGTDDTAALFQLISEHSTRWCAFSTIWDGMRKVRANVRTPKPWRTFCQDTDICARSFGTPRQLWRT